jgi:hypothetical protein
MRGKGKRFADLQKISVGTPAPIAPGEALGIPSPQHVVVVPLYLLYVGGGGGATGCGSVAIPTICCGAFHYMLGWEDGRHHDYRHHAARDESLAMLSIWEDSCYNDNRHHGYNLCAGPIGRYGNTSVTIPCWKDSRARKLPVGREGAGAARACSRAWPRGPSA